MPRSRTLQRVVKPFGKGQITIPAEFREALGIGSDTLLTVTLEGDRLVVKPVSLGNEGLREYTEQEIAQFLEEDKLDPEVGRKVRELLRKGSL